MKNEGTVYDFAIIGGGVSGIYTGWRLLTSPLGSGLAAGYEAQGGRLKIGVFEGSDRIGGRLLSARPPGMPHVTCEIGGMRFVSTQKLVSSLVLDKLKLPVHEQTVDVPTNIAYLRGEQMRVSQLTDSAYLPYDLSWAEQQWLLGNDNPAQPNSPTSLIGWAVKQLLPQVESLSGQALSDYLQAAEIDGVPLYKHGFWNVLARAMSMEAYSLCRTTIGYDSLGANANAVDLCMEYFDFTPGEKYYLLNDGFDAVPWNLQDQFEGAGGEVIMDSWVEGFDSVTLADGTVGVRIEFTDGRPAVTARSIVLAMPQRSLERLRQGGPVMDPAKAPQVRFLMDSVEPIALYKLFLSYPYPWWEQLGVTAGRSLTDLPLRQCYYWAVEGRQTGANPANTNSVVMAYNDMSSSEFWGGLRTCALGPDDSTVMGSAKGEHLFPRKEVAHTAEHGDDWVKRLRDNWDGHRAPREMVREMHKQVCLLHDVTYAPEPIDAAFMDWTDDPFGGGVHFWNPGYKSWEVLESMTQPVEDFPCFVCGESYSTNQTWVEGALQTAEIVLQKRLGLPPPDWLATEEQ